MTTLVAPRPAAPVQLQQRPANREAQQITGRDYVSHTQLSLMRSCPLKFARQYVENAPKDFVPVSLLHGGCMHEALESFYRGRLEGVTVTASAMFKAYQTAWQQHRINAGEAVPVRFGKKDDETTVHALAQRTIDAFLSSPLANPKGIVLGIEEQLRVTLHPDLPDVLAKVDLVTQTEGSLHIVDFKTSRSKWTEQKALESSDQLVLYGMTAAGMSRHLGVPIKLHFAVLTKAKNPVVQLLPVPTDAARITTMTDTALQTWSAIKAGNFYPNPSPLNCSTCPFKSRCLVFGGTPIPF